MENLAAVSTGYGTLGDVRIRVTAYLPTATANGGSREELDIELFTPTETRFVDITPQLASLCGVDERTAFFVEGRQLTGSELLGTAPLVDGARIGVRRALSPQRRQGPRQLRVISGPDAGHVFDMGITELRIGRSSQCHIRLADGDLSRVHATITAGPDGVMVADADSTNGVFIDGVRITAETELAPGALLRCGASILMLCEPDAPPASLRPDGAGGLALVRPPRIKPASTQKVLRYPAPPPTPHRIRLPWLMTLAPLFCGGLLYLTSKGNQIYLLIMVLTPVLMLINALSDRITGARRHRKELAAHERKCQELDTERTAALADEAALRHREAPDPASSLLAASEPTTALWERRLADVDALSLRIGLAEQAAHLAVITEPSRDCSHPTITAVPVLVDLAKVHVLGVHGEPRHALVRWLITQLATLRSPRDLRIAIVNAHQHAWARWLPHLDTSAGQTAMASDGAAIRELVAELVEVVQTREGHQNGFAAVKAPESHIVVVLDDAQGLRGVPGVRELLTRGPAVGIYPICVAEQQRLLPEECQAVIGLSAYGTAELRIAGEPAVTGITADLVGVDIAARVSRALTPFRDASTASGGDLPNLVRFREIVAEVKPTEIAKRWEYTPQKTSVPVGIGANGIVAIDIAVDGPHALIAGSTGSGKSELLQTLVTSLALHNSPAELAFILVDYKGGAAFADCARLPHTVGMVTDLDPRLTARALTSLRAELRRREELLTQVGAVDIAAYHQSRMRPQLARLVLVIDEFAALATELPEFLVGLVDVARRGRSLGMHLVLATQRPQGVVSAEIRTNTALRMCLRVNDPAESMDVIETPLAAAINRRQYGRGYAKLADGTTAVQVAWVGGPAESSTAPIHIVRPWLPLNSEPTVVSAPETRTELSTVVDSIIEATEQAGIPTTPSPWLPGLANDVPLAELPPAPPHHATLGWHDEPHQQRRIPYLLDLNTGGNLAIIGRTRSGRSTALRTLAVSAALSTDPAQLQVFIADCGSGGNLRDLDTLPHCAGYADPTDLEHLSQLLSMVDSLIQQRTMATSSSMLLIDSWEGLRDAFDDASHPVLDQLLPRIVRTGPASGLQLIITGDRPLLTSSVGRTISNRLLLPQADRDAYLAAGLSTRDIPADMPAGRALIMATENVPATEVQVAVANTELVSRQSSNKPTKLLPLPESVRYQGEDGQGWWTPLGIVSDSQRAGSGEPHTLTTLGIDVLREGPGVMIAGPHRSGRSTALLAIANHHLMAGKPLCVLAPQRSPLTTLAERHVPVFGREDSEDLRAVLRSGCLLLIDDIEAMIDSPADAVVREIFTRGELPIVAAANSDDVGTVYRGTVMEIRRSRTGVLLWPRRNHGDLFGVRLEPARLRRPGRGIFVRGSETCGIQLFS